MNPHLIYRDRDLNIKDEKVWNHAALTQDLGLKIMFGAMSGGDDLLDQVSRSVILSSDLPDLPTILYRQGILKDCIAHIHETEELFHLATAAVDSRKNTWYGIYTSRPSSMLSSGIGLMRIYLKHLKGIRDFLNLEINSFHSDGFIKLNATLQNEIPDSYLDEIERQLKLLEFNGGILMSATVGKGNRGEAYQLHSFIQRKKSWWSKLFPPKSIDYTFEINPRDESGTREITELNDQAIREVANILANADDHIMHFFTTLQNEMAFYIGGLHLYQKLEKLGQPVCFPEPTACESGLLNASALYDPCLALSLNKSVAANDLAAEGKPLVIITGANKGGKSTFLRSVGIAHLMMQCGMFVAAKTMKAGVCSGIFTHFKREEDNTMESGKFDEELHRMDEIATHLKPFSLLLFNESFAATNEREGSEVARQIVNALLEQHNKVFFVTHLYELSNWYYQHTRPESLFLRAINDDSFVLTESAPEKTSNGIELYHRMFEDE